MPEFELVLRDKGNPSHRYPIPRSGLRIGRSSQNDVRLTNQLVSRFHAVVRPKGSGLFVEDLESSNGIEVNGKPVKAGPLQEGDKLLVGDSVFIVVKKSESTVGQTVIGPDNAAAIHAEMLAESGARLRVLYDAANLLGSVLNLEELCRKILDLLFSALPVRRGYVITVASESHAPEVRAALSKEAGDSGPPLSHTLIQHVFTHKEAMLTTDAQTDSRFDSTDSIVGYDIHSAMCAPLLGRDRAVVGALYVDSGTSSQAFTREQLELLTAIARVVGIAVENARLHNEAVARERLAAIGEATAGLGHCVKNILTAIRGGAEFVDLAISRQDIKTLERGWPILARAIERIDMLVMNMLTLSKERQPERTPTDLNALIAEVLELERPRAQRHHVELVASSNQPVVVEVDGRQIYRVILNLVENAITACMQEGGRVEVACELRRSGCALTVTDTGQGIPPEKIPHLFEAFTSSKGSAGTGLGLACSYKIVREHHGEIEVQSTVGEGTCVKILLPSDPRATAQA